MLTVFLISVLTVCAIVAALSFLILLADALIARYPDVTVTINEDRSLTAPGGRPLLAVLKDQGVFLPSACGGRGSCGLCKCRITAGGGELLPTEIPWLSPEEQKGQVRLSCQVKTRRDLSVRIPEELLSVRQYKASVSSLVDLTDDIKQVTLALSEPPEIHFQAGQFIQFEVPPYKLTDEPVYRAYSISSSPSDSRNVELEVRLVPNGICTTYIHQFLKPGDAVAINGPYGEFHLSDTDRPILFIAGGSGMAPIKSMLLHMRETGCPRSTRYFFGARTRADLFLSDLMADLERDLPDFRFIPALSAPSPDDHWTGEAGLITEVLGRHLPGESDAEAYLCGSPAMIDAAVAVLKTKGIPEARIYYDKFA